MTWWTPEMQLAAWKYRAETRQNDGTGYPKSDHGMWRDHTCWKCREGEKPCVAGNPRQCEYPHARND